MMDESQRLRECSKSAQGSDGGKVRAAHRPPSTKPTVLLEVLSEHWGAKYPASSNSIPSTTCGLPACIRTDTGALTPLPRSDGFRSQGKPGHALMCHYFPGFQPPGSRSEIAWQTGVFFSCDLMPHGSSGCEIPAKAFTQGGSCPPNPSSAQR